MDFGSDCRENPVLHRKIYGELISFETKPEGEGFPVGFSSFSTLASRSHEGSSSNPFSGFSAPCDDPFQASCNGKQFHKNQFSTKFTEDGAEAHMHGLQTRRFLDLNSEASLKITDQCQINVPLKLNSCSVLDNDLRNKSTEKTVSVQMKSETRVDKKSNIIKGQWTPEEDRLLVELVEKHGVGKWCVIAQKLSGRLGKQCRERWHNHLKPDLKKDRWSDEEDKMLIEAHRVLGNKWAEMTRRLPGRSENTIKNHWNATKRRILSRKDNTPKYNTLLQNYIKTVISSSNYIKPIENSSSASISSICTMVNSMQREQIEMKTSSDTRMQVHIDVQKEMDFMGILSSRYI
ncbi:myb domain protein [Abeliophyllum distichum]|uniref:Myb domain protein n=1 Tax=Abeliophyllum distichum TaxID=126358 RepID=A0ABD1SH60_9LAMI